MGEIAGVKVSRGGWAKKPAWKGHEDEIRKRWVERSYEHRSDAEEGMLQCGGCSHFAAWDADYGFCTNLRSQMDGRVCFEHGGCRYHSVLEEGRDG